MKGGNSSNDIKYKNTPKQKEEKILKPNYLGYLVFFYGSSMSMYRLATISQSFDAMCIRGVLKTLSISSVVQVIKWTHSPLRDLFTPRSKVVSLLPLRGAILQEASISLRGVIYYKKHFFSPRCPSCGSCHPCFERRFPASSYKTRKICVCPLITHDRCTSLATITDVPLLLWKHILYPYMHIHMLHDANRLSHFSLHLALEEADSVPRGTCLTPALEVRSHPQSALVLRVLIPSLRSLFMSCFPPQDAHYPSRPDSLLEVLGPSENCFPPPKCL